MELILEKLYLNRFNEKEKEAKKRLWKYLCSDFFQKFIPADSRVVDMGASLCEFINAIKAREKIAVDKLVIGRFADKDVKIFSNLDELEPNSVDIIFMSNFLEHLAFSEDVFAVLSKVRVILKRGAKVIIIGPNIRFAYKNYWNFIDHKVALSDLSLAEALLAMDFKIIKKVPRFLPFTTKSKYPKWTWLVRLYLNAPFLWRIFGKQYLIVCQK